MLVAKSADRCEENQASERNQTNSLALITRRWARVAAATALILTAVSFSAAQTSAPQTNRVEIHAGRLLEAKTGRWLPDQSIYVEGDKIAPIEAGAPKTAPE
jgi:hypothetical protein